ncbi:hypothetical protein FNF31_07135 [Cafeteria roenbergensis]|uniref:C3H1-type domain-containing protein n=1 Tax=Cafeteria roenbergensis TaxID=33653 RepID=A0A5A8CAR4_CAFRO|nr:hypothetical protein FNF31_07135 [Cafeteria roenbergensis]
MDSRRSTERYKSKICLFWLQPEGCRYGSDCWFAHGPDEIRTTANSNTPGNSPATNLRYKVRICRHWSESGGDWCPHGVRLPRVLKQPAQRLQQLSTSRARARL